MPSYDTYRKWYGLTAGQAKHLQSQDLIDASWDADYSSQVAYLYDWYSDLKSPEAHRLRDLHPQSDPFKIPIDVKYLTNSSQTYSKDPVTYHIQLRPHQKCNVDYYDERFGCYAATFPVGLYIELMDAEGIYNRWMVVGLANYWDSSFQTYEVLPCDHLFQWVFAGSKYQMAGVLRSQNSYNRRNCVLFAVIGNVAVYALELRERP